MLSCGSRRGLQAHPDRAHSTAEEPRLYLPRHALMHCPLLTAVGCQLSVQHPPVCSCLATQKKARASCNQTCIAANVHR